MRKAFGLILLLAATTTQAKDDKKPAPSLDGSYVLIAIEEGGEKIPNEILTKESEEERTLVFKGGKIISTKKKRKEESLEFKLDASKTPAEIDLKETKGDNPETSYGIYKLEGDTLIICLVESDKAADRPKEFKTAKGSKAVMMTLKKKDK